MKHESEALSVLVIDDDAELVRLLSQLFAREGIALRSATTGAAGLEGLSPVPSLVLPRSGPRPSNLVRRVDSSTCACGSMF